MPCAGDYFGIIGYSFLIKGRFTYIGLRDDGAPMYKDARGNTWALEGNHWDILFP